MKGLVLENAGQARVANLPEPDVASDQLLLQVDMVGLCGSDLNSFRGRNPLVTYPRVLGHEIAATVLTGTREIPVDTRVTVSPYTACGACSACRQGRENACRNNRTLGVQRDGAIAELLSTPSAKIYPGSSLSTKQLCMVEPLTVGFHAVRRGRVTAADTVAVFGCGGSVWAPSRAQPMREREPSRSI